MELWQIYTVNLTMRRLLIVLMIALLPLRTWAGDVMGVDMAASALAGASSAVAAHHPAAATVAMETAASDCDGHADASPSAAAQAHCKTCVTCQICHSVAVLMLTPGVMPQLLVPLVPATGTPHFTSAERALGQKPPIS
jgi:hypothetical protein